MKSRLKRANRLVVRLFLIGCVIYTVVSNLIDYGISTQIGISATTCSGIFIDASSEEELKRLLLESFAPTFIFSLGEPANLDEEVIVPYQIVPDQLNTGRYVWRGAVTYPIDYGSSSAGARLGIGSNRYSISLSRHLLRFIGWAFGQAHSDSHIGDVEMFELYLKPVDEENGYWEIHSLVTFPHGIRRIYNAGQVRCFRNSPLIYVSRGKHAMYASLQECNHFSGMHRRGLQLTAEHCSVAELYYPSTSPEFNVGDSTNPINIFETSPTILESEIFQGEDAWGSCFYGGYGNDDNGDPCRSWFRWW